MAKKRMGCRNCWNQFLTWTLGVLELALGILIIGTVFWHLTDYDVTVTSSFDCLLCTDPSSSGLCVYTYVVVGIGMFCSLVIMMTACTCGERYERARHHMEWGFALFGLLWYLVAAIIISNKVKRANDDNNYQIDWRNGVAVALWVLACLFAAHLVIGILMAAGDCCPCFGRKKGAKKDVEDKAEKQDAAKDNKEDKKAEQKDVETGEMTATADTTPMSDQQQLPTPPTECDVANPAAAAAVTAAVGTAAVAVPTTVALAASAHAANGADGQAADGGKVEGSVKSVPAALEPAGPSAGTTVDSSSTQSLQPAVGAAPVNTGVPTTAAGGAGGDPAA